MGAFKWETKVVVKPSGGTKTSHMHWHGKWTNESILKKIVIHCGKNDAHKNKYAKG